MYELKNYMEILVDEMLDKTLEKFDICKCEKCRLDIKAIALNSLRPIYIVSTKGGVYARINMLQQQFTMDIVSAITKASIIVGENQRHE